MSKIVDHALNQQLPQYMPADVAAGQSDGRMLLEAMRIHPTMLQSSEHSWMIGVLADLSSYAERHGLTATSEQLQSIVMELAEDVGENRPRSI